MWPLLKTFSWQEITHHPWRTAVAVLAVMLGVALAYAVHLINASALAEFGSAAQAVSGRPDVSLRARQGSLPDTLLDRVAAHPQVAVPYTIRSIPTMVLFKNGKEAARVSGAMGAADIVRWVQSVQA